MKFAYELLDKMVASLKEFEKQGLLKVKYRSIEIDEERKEISLHISIGFDEASWLLIFREQEGEPKVIRLEFSENVKTEEKVQK